MFVPLRMIHSGLNEAWISGFLFFAAVPLILSEYYFSKRAGKHGFKKIFKRGYLLTSLVAFACFLFASNIYLVMGLVVLASVGMAMLEPTTEAYFFDILKGNEEYRFYAPYNTAVDFGGFTGRFLASIVLLVLPFEFIFVVFGVLMFSLFLLSFKTKNVIEKRKISHRA